MKQKAFLLCRFPYKKGFEQYIEYDAGEQEIAFVDFHGNALRFRSIQQEPQKVSEMELPLPSYSGQVSERENHLSLLQNVIAVLKQHPERKVVLARNRFDNRQLDLAKSLRKLADHFPSAFVYLLYHPNCGAWLGATPELLGGFSDDLFQTMALAGTKKPEQNWTPKEHHEHQFVIDHILQRLPSGIPEQTTTFSYGSIQHLHTPIVQANLSFDAACELPKTLHPTSAICGSPTEWAQSYILDHEGFERSLYTGYLGVRDSAREKFAYYVNLRCIALYANGFLGFAGGGITHQSRAEDEWQETENKLDSFFSQLV